MKMELLCVRTSYYKLCTCFVYLTGFSLATKLIKTMLQKSEGKTLSTQVPLFVLFYVTRFYYCMTFSVQCAQTFLGK